MFEDLLNNVYVLETLESEAEDVSSDVECGAVDGKDAAGVLHTINVGAIATTPAEANHTRLVLQDSDDNSTWADVTDENVVKFKIGDTITAMEDATTGLLKALDAAGDADKLYTAQYTGQKRYSRILLKAVGTVTDIDIGLTAMVFGLGHSGAALLLGAR